MKEPVITSSEVAKPGKIKDESDLFAQFNKKDDEKNNTNNN